MTFDLWTLPLPFGLKKAKDPKRQTAAMAQKGAVNRRCHQTANRAMSGEPLS